MSEMTESEFHQLADQTIESLQDAIDESGADIDFVESGGVLTLEFENRSKIIFSKQPAMSQLWMAALAGGFHFDHDSDNKSWVCDAGDNEELVSMFNRLATEQAGEEVNLNF